MQFIIIFVFSIIFLCTPIDAKTNKIPMVNSIDKIIDQYTKMINKRYNLKVEGLGSDRKDNFLKCVFVSTRVSKSVDIEEARNLYIECVDLLLEELNRSANFKQYMIDYPFTLKNLEFFIRFTDPKGDWQTGRDITIIMNKNNKIFYEVMETNDSPLKTIHTETYEEAKNIFLGCKKDK